MVVDHLQQVVGLEGLAAHDHFVQGHAQCVQVGARVHGTAGAAGLLGRHVGQGAGDVALVHEAGPLFGKAGGDVEVDQQRAALGAHQQHIAGVDVLVDDAQAVHRGQGLGQFDGNRQHRRHTRPPLQQHMGQRHAVHIHQGQAVCGLLGIEVDDPVDAGQALQHAPLMAQARLGFVAKGLLQHDGVAVGQVAARDQGALVAVDHLVLDARCSQQEPLAWKGASLGSK